MAAVTKKKGTPKKGVAKNPPSPTAGMVAMGVPAPLATAIANASATYGVPEDILVGIWKIESGGSYPNPYVNSSGYGGLFGTSNWNDTTQNQANTAASILATQYQENGGDLGAALLAYSGGAANGGYSSVPGQTSTTLGPVNPNAYVTGGSAGNSSVGNPPAGWPPAGTPFSKLTRAQISKIGSELLSGSVTAAQVNAWYSGANITPSHGVAGTITSDLGLSNWQGTLLGVTACVGGGILLLGGVILVAVGMGAGGTAAKIAGAATPVGRVASAPKRRRAKKQETTARAEVASRRQSHEENLRKSKEAIARAKVRESRAKARNVEGYRPKPPPKKPVKPDKGPSYEKTQATGDSIPF